MATRLTLVTRFTYRGDPTEEYSNTYSLRGVTPTSEAGWDTLAAALADAQRQCQIASHSIVRAYCYDSDDPNADNVHVWVPTTPPVGALSVPTGARTMPGDDAVWVRWKTPRKTSPGGKPIYLRKYFHGALATDATGPALDSVYSTQRTALLAFGTKLMDGSFLDARTITGPGHLEDMLSRDASTYITTRTLKRRGKRPPTLP